MRISLLQPHIVRGDIVYNRHVIQRLAEASQGDLLVLPEYALTGSLVLDRGADVWEWARASADAKALFRLPEGKCLLVNALTEFDGQLYNCCDLLPTRQRYCKLFPDQTERDAGIVPGTEQKVFELLCRRFKAVVCFDLPHMDQIPTQGLDFLLFIYHFTRENLSRVLPLVRDVSRARGLPVLASSLVSDKNDGFSSYVNGDVVVSLPRQEGILEVEI
jgi:predicted amidohydrolase